MQRRTHRPSVPDKRIASGSSSDARPARLGRAKRRNDAPAAPIPETPAADGTEPRATSDTASGALAGAKDAVRNIVSGNVKLTRRQVVAGTAGVVAVGAVAVGVGVAASHSSTDEDSGASAKAGDLSILNVPEDAVFTTEQCEYLEAFDDFIRLSATASLPYGTMLWASDNDVAACLLPSDTSNPLTTIGLLSLRSGYHETVVDQAIGAAERFQIYDVRASSNGVAWVEADILDNLWRIYHADLDGLHMGSPVMVYEGDGQFVMPSIAVVGGHTYWQLVPNVPGRANTYTSSLLRAPIGSGAEGVETLLEAPGKMACGLTAGASGVNCAPRAEANSVYYALTHVDGASGQVTDQLILPASMKPATVGYGNTGFTFSFENIYAAPSGISNLGTYTPLTLPAYNLATAYEDAVAGMLETSKDGTLTEMELEAAAQKSLQAVADLYSSEQWFRFPRTPLTSPSWCGNWLMVRSTNVVAGVDLVGRRYFTLEAEGTNQGYGEFLASQDGLDRAVTYANVDYTPLEGEPIKECSVRIWDAL